MGNCIRHQSWTRYATDDDDYDWEDFQAVADEGGGSFAAAAAAAAASTNGKKTTTEVKIKITKKQLEELLVKVEVKELRVEQVLAHLVAHSRAYHSLQRPWKPALHSIPEIN